MSNASVKQRIEAVQDWIKFMKRDSNKELKSKKVKKKGRRNRR